MTGRAPFSRLIYPVPEAAGLGVHLTLDLGGQAKFGPDVQWLDAADDLVVDPRRGDAFYAEVRRYWPALQDGALLPGYAGMRPKISGPGEPAADFVILHRVISARCTQTSPGASFSSRGSTKPRRCRPISARAAK